MKKEIKKPLPKNYKSSKKNNLAKRILLCLFIFWTVGSIVALSCLVWLVSDNHNNDTAMITANADTSATLAEMPYVSVNLNNGLSRSYARVDGTVYLWYSNIEVLIGSLGDRTVIIDGTRLDFTYDSYNAWQNTYVSFYDSTLSTDYQSVYNPYTVFFRWLDRDNYLLDDSYRLETVTYNLSAPESNTITVAFSFYKIDGSSRDTIVTALQIQRLAGVFTLYSAYSEDISYNNWYVNQLRAQVYDLNRQITQLNDTIFGLRQELTNSTNMYESEIESLNNSILSMSNTIADKNAQIEELEQQIRTITEGSARVYRQGYDDGFAEGSSATAADAFNQGYAAAVEDGHGGSNFRSLIGALIDVPVNAITSLLDWNLLGINLKEFFFSILSVIVVVKIAMLFMR